MKKKNVLPLFSFIYLFVNLETFTLFKAIDRDRNKFYVMLGLLQESENRNEALREIELQLLPLIYDFTAIFTITIVTNQIWQIELHDL